MIRSTMSDFPLTINAILRHGRRIHATSECVTFTGDGVRRTSYSEVADNADRLAAALTRLGIQAGDAVGTFMWNDQEHLEAYFAVPCMGAVLHTLNIRLSREQLVYVTNHAGDRVVIVDASLLSVIGAVASELTTVEAWIVVGDGDTSALEATGRPVYRYDELARRRVAGLRLPRARRERGRGHVLHERHDGRPEGRGVLAPLDVPALDHRMHAGRHRRRRVRPHPRDRPAVPRQRLGAAVRRVPVRRVVADARSVPAGRAAVPVHRRGAADRLARLSRRCGPTCSATATTTRSTCRRCAWSCAAGRPSPGR